MTSDLVLSRRELDFLLFDWLKVEALMRRARFAGQDRFANESVLDVYAKLATDLFAPHNKKNDRVEPSFDGERVTVNEEVGVALRAAGHARALAIGIPTLHFPDHP